MKKTFLFLIFVLMAIPAFALTSGKIPVATSTSSPGIPSTTGDSDITDVNGVSITSSVPLSITGSLNVSTVYDIGAKQMIAIDGNNYLNVGNGSTGNTAGIIFYPGTTNSLTLISNGELYTNALADYSASSTIAGFSSISTKYIYTKKIGKTVNVNFGFQGTSNSPTITFTLPYETAASTPAIYQTIFTSTNSTSAIGILYSVGSAYSVEVWPTAVQGSWTNGASGFWGQFSYQSV